MIRFSFICIIILDKIIRPVNYLLRSLFLILLQAYWEWSWDELVHYDLSSFVQYVHDQTGQKLHYVGHSLVKLLYFVVPPLVLEYYFFLDFLKHNS